MKHRVAYLVRGKRAYRERTFSLDQAKREVRALKRRGMTAWVETESGGFVPIPGAKRRPSFLEDNPYVTEDEYERCVGGRERGGLLPPLRSVNPMKKPAPGRIATKNGNPALTYGTLPSREEFARVVEPELPFYAEFRGEDARVADEIGYDGEEIDDPDELYEVIENLIELWEDGDEAAGDLASGIMEVSGFEWI